MSLSPDTLYPLTSTTVEFEYCHDRPLLTLATRLLPPDRTGPQGDSSRVVCSLVLCPGISLQKETWLPVIKELYQHASQPESRVTIYSIWVIERPNHGDAAVLNEVMLKEHYNVIFPSLQYAAAIRAFFDSPILSPVERANLIAVGHSGGGGSILQALETATSKLPISRLVLIESPHVGHEAREPLKVLYEIIKAFNARRQNSWSSVEEAMKYFKGRPPCKMYHPEVWKIMSETYFRKDPQAPERVTTKTTAEQETACFFDDGTHLGSLDYLRTILHVLPTDLIFGTVEDLWPPGLYELQRKNIEQTKHSRDALVSVTIVEGAGHYLPVQMPKQLAAEMSRLLDGYVAQPPHARL